MASATEEQNFKFCLTLIIHNLNLNLHMCLAATLLAAYVYGIETEPLDDFTSLFHNREQSFLYFPGNQKN